MLIKTWKVWKEWKEWKVWKCGKCGKWFKLFPHSCVVDEKNVQNIKIMNEIKDNISKNEIIYNVKPRELFESSIRKDIQRKKIMTLMKARLKRKIII